MRSKAGWHARAWVALVVLVTLGAGCASAPGRPAVEAPRERGFPGFDTNIYPGDAALQAWRRPGSPYHWVGYYLPAPCRRDSSWAGKRSTLESMGWGLAVLYVGQQTWDNVRDVAAPAQRTDSVVTPADSAAATPAAPVSCSRTLLSAERGRADADDAVARAAADGFARGTTIFLNIERMEQVSAPMRDYYRAWVGRLLQEGRYRPGLYAHHRNAAELHADFRDAYRAAGAAGVPPLWIANPSGFSLLSAPRESGPGEPMIWQGALDVQRTWNGFTLMVDENVADTPSPSAPPAMFPGNADPENECSTASCTWVVTTGTSRR
jgi:hypothetical protein